MLHASLQRPPHNSSPNIAKQPKTRLHGFDRKKPDRFYRFHIERALGRQNG